jgi:hypothetical protein
MGEENAIELTKEDYEKVIQGCEKQFELMKNTRREMEVAEVFQKVLYEFAKKKLEEFPKKIPAGVG